MKSDFKLRYEKDRLINFERLEKIADSVSDTMLYIYDNIRQLTGITVKRWPQCPEMEMNIYVKKFIFKKCICNIRYDIERNCFFVNDIEYSNNKEIILECIIQILIDHDQGKDFIESMILRRLEQHIKNK